MQGGNSKTTSIPLSFATLSSRRRLGAIHGDVFKPAPQHEKTLNGVFGQVIAWSGALKTLRTK